MPHLALILSLLIAQTAPPVPPPCQAPGHSQFDFWVGEWEVYGPQGKLSGRNVITRDHGGCVIAERWTGAGGMTGSSFNLYRPSTNTWLQIWVDSGGNLLRLEGEFRDGAMRMEGRTTTPKGARLDRITWTPRADGTLRQLWESSLDGGMTWQVAFDGTYRKPTQ